MADNVIIGTAVRSEVDVPVGKLGSERPSDLPKVAQPVSVNRTRMRTLLPGSKFKTFSLSHHLGCRSHAVISQRAQRHSLWGTVSGGTEER